MSAINLKSYFERIGYTGSIAPTLATLEALLALHPAALAYSTLDVALARPVALDIKALERKLLTDRRGGIAIEHAVLLGAVLEDLDFSLRRVLARRMGADEAPLAVLLVDISGALYLADPNSGPSSPAAPLRLRDGVEQETPHERFRLTQQDGMWRLEIERSEDWQPVYEFATDGIDDAALAGLAGDPAARLGAGLVVSLAPRGERLTLEANRLTRRPREGEPETEDLVDLAAVKTALGERFGISVPADPEVDVRLASILPVPPPPEQLV